MTLYQLVSLDSASAALIPADKRSAASVNEQLIAAALMRKDA